jgi:hypothetical protein
MIGNDRDRCTAELAHVHIGDDMEAMEDLSEVDGCRTVAAPATSAKERLAALQGSEAARDFAVYWLPAEYYRLRALVGAAVIFLAALPALYTTPIVGLLLAPSSALTIYWLIDAKRFQAGGDIRAFVNRPCALLYLTVCGASSTCIAVYDVVSLSLTLSSSTQASSAASKAGAEGDAVHTLHHSRSYYILCMAINAVLLVSLVYLLMVLRKLRKVLE